MSFRCIKACFVYSSHIRFLIYYGLCLKTAVNVFFIDFIVNFNAVCDAYTVQRHYTVLLKTNRICLTSGIFSGNYILRFPTKLKILYDFILFTF